MKTKFVKPTIKTGKEAFTFKGTAIDLSLFDYWAWAYSDLTNNVYRGKLAEFIVASALGITNSNGSTWDSFDLMFMGKCIEVKSSAYLQSWHQERESVISFDVRPTLGVIGNTATYDNNRKRQSDAYVFCVLTHKDKLTLDPLNLEQWEFYPVSTTLLNLLIPTQQTVSLAFFRKNNIIPCSYGGLRQRIEQILQPDSCKDSHINQNTMNIEGDITMEEKAYSHGMSLRNS